MAEARSAAPRGPLEVAGVEVRAGGMRILHGASLRLFPGELVALIGPSGAGKSTLIKVLLGLRTPQVGEVHLGGLSLKAAGAPVGYVPQQDALHLSLTPRQALGFAAQLRLPHLSEAERRDRVEAVAEQVGLTERLDVRSARLSGGQKKRVSVALELLTLPPVLILDEPTSGLDPGLEARMTGLFRELAEGGRIVLVATHAMESLHLAHVLVVLVGGWVAFAGSPEDALTYFRAEGFATIFRQLPKIEPGAWGKRWLRAPERAAFLNRGGPILPPPAPSEPPPIKAQAETPREDAPTPVPSAAERLAALKAAREKAPSPGEEPPP